MDSLLAAVVVGQPVCQGLRYGRLALGTRHSPRGHARCLCPSAHSVGKRLIAQVDLLAQVRVPQSAAANLCYQFGIEGAGAAPVFDVGQRAAQQVDE